MNTPGRILCYIALLIASLVTRVMSEVAVPNDILRDITLLAYADDFEDQKLVETYRELALKSRQNFPDYVNILQASDDDRVLKMTLTIAAAEAGTRRDEINDILTQFLTNRDPRYYPLTVERALSILGRSGTIKHLSLVARFESDPNGVISRAAKTASTKLKAQDAEGQPSAK